MASTDRESPQGPLLRETFRAYAWILIEQARIIGDLCGRDSSRYREMSDAAVQAFRATRTHSMREAFEYLTSAWHWAGIAEGKSYAPA